MSYQHVLVTLSEFEKINEESYQNGYNRTLHYDGFLKEFKEEMDSDSGLVWISEDENYVLLKFCMFHDWKKFVPCDRHIRALVYNGIGKWDGLTLDLDIATWERLQMTRENLALKELHNKLVKEVA
jgi:hypothetical protein